MHDEKQKNMREETESMVNRIYEMRVALRKLEARYHKSDVLCERLAGVSVRRINVLLDEAYREILILDNAFQK
ncbi:MAG: hypothetical protein XXXJIFNMEKO3_LKCDNKCA_00153 (plasmid) [Candidatus Erwinia impunctatus]